MCARYCLQTRHTRNTRIIYTYLLCTYLLLPRLYIRQATPMTKFSSSRTLGFRHFVPYLVPYFGGFVQGRKFGNIGIFCQARMDFVSSHNICSCERMGLFVPRTWTFCPFVILGGLPHHSISSLLGLFVLQRWTLCLLKILFLRENGTFCPNNMDILSIRNSRWTSPSLHFVLTWTFCPTKVDFKSYIITLFSVER